MARPISRRRMNASGNAWRTGDIGCSSSVAKVAADSMNNPRPAASIRYSGQWCRSRSSMMSLGCARPARVSAESRETRTACSRHQNVSEVSVTGQFISDEREWLEADGLGGFASGTVSGVRTRRYHGLLLVATTPPTGRMMLVNGFDAWVETKAGRQAISSQRYGPDVIHPDGASRIESFTH